MTILQIWQEHECDACAIDFDLMGSEIIAQGESCYCSGCGGHHAAGVEPGPTETMALHAPDDEHPDEWIEVRPLPRDAIEKAAWLAEVREAG